MTTATINLDTLRALVEAAAVGREGWELLEEGRAAIAAAEAAEERRQAIADAEQRRESERVALRSRRAAARDAHGAGVRAALMAASRHLTGNRAGRVRDRITGYTRTSGSPSRGSVIDCIVDHVLFEGRYADGQWRGREDMGRHLEEACLRLRLAPGTQRATGLTGDVLEPYTTEEGRAHLPDDVCEAVVAALSNFGLAS